MNYARQRQKENQKEKIMKNKSEYKKKYQSISGTEIYTDARSEFLGTAITISTRQSNNKNMVAVKICNGILLVGNKKIKTFVHISSQPELISSFALKLDKNGNPIQVNLLIVVEGTPIVEAKQTTVTSLKKETL